MPLRSTVSTKSHSTRLPSNQKDGGHNIRSAVCENPMLHAHFTAACAIDAELLVMKFLHCADMQWKLICHDTHTSVACVLVVDLFQSCDLDLDQMTFIYALYLYRLETDRMCKLNFLREVFRKLPSAALRFVFYANQCTI